MKTESPEWLFEKFAVLECWKKDERSAVYLAHHRFLDKQIVLKTLNVDLTADPAAAERFKQEAKCLAQLDHPQVITVLDFGVYGSFFYISFEHFDGQTLRNRMAGPPLSAEQKLAIFFQIVQALAVVHRRGIVHRDVKPENILINDDLHVKLADFGLAHLSDAARVTEKSSILGTPGYMAPEQIRGEALTPAVDVFSLGIVGYELCTGVNPFLGPDIGSTINNILTRPENDLWNQPTGMAPELARSIRACLQRNSQKRPATAESVCEELAVAFPYLRGTCAGPVSVPGKTGAGYRRFFWLLAPMVIILLALFWLRPIRDNKPAPVQADSLPAATVPDHVQSQPVMENKPVAGKEAPTVPSAPVGDPGRLSVFCLPWAEVWIDNMKMDVTPMNEALRLYPGDHELALQHPDYPIWRKKLHMNSGANMTVSVRLDTLFGFFQPLIHPWGEVFVDGARTGITPFVKAVALEPGLHRLEIRHPQYDPFTDNLTISPGDTQRYELDFSKIVQRGRP